MPLTNLDLTDRELLHAISAATTNGYATSEDVADELGVPPKGKLSRGARVASRLSWMRRNGLLERLDPKDYGRSSKERLWVITTLGKDIMRGRLPASVERAIEGAGAGTSVVMMRQLTRRAYVQASYEEATAVRREYLHNVAQRPRRR